MCVCVCVCIIVHLGRNMSLLCFLKRSYIVRAVVFL